MNYYIFNKELYLNFINTVTEDQILWIWNNTKAFVNTFYSKAKLVKINKFKNVAKFKLISGKIITLNIDRSYGYIVKDINDKNELKDINEFIQYGLSKRSYI